MLSQQATDKDEGENSNIIYSIQSGNDAGGFIINQITGLITTTENITKITDEKLTLTIVAQDSSEQETPKQSIQPVTVTVSNHVLNLQS